MTLDLNNHSKLYFLDSINPIKYGNKIIKAILLPHASNKYINSIIYPIFNGINLDSFDKILILTTNHNSKKNYTPSSFFLTFNEQLLELEPFIHESVEMNDEYFYNEHSYLSILSTLFNFNKKIQIIAIGHYNQLLCDYISEMIMNENILLIANTDLLHCGPNYNISCPSNISLHNLETIQDILNDRKINKNDACGIPVIEMFQCIINNTNLKDKWTQYVYNSSDQVFDYDKNENSVGYVGIEYSDSIPSYLVEIPKKVLDYIYRNEIKDFCTREFSIAFRKYYNLPYYVKLKDVTGIFVTIEYNNQLRGCIGTFTLDNHFDIIDVIIEKTLDSLCNDSRFKPVPYSLLPELTTKINFLKKSFPIDYENFNDIFQLGLHGITVYFQDGKSATYLPSVLYDFKNKDEIIESLRKKANSKDEIKKIELYESIEL